MNVLLACSLFLIAFSLGVIVSYFKLHLNHGGRLVVDMSDPNRPYPYLQLYENIEDSILPYEYVTLKIDKVAPNSQD